MTIDVLIFPSSFFFFKQSHTYTIGEQADIVENLVQQINLNSLHVLAHDYGDTVALELLSRWELLL